MFFFFKPFLGIWGLLPFACLYVLVGYKTSNKMVFARKTNTHKVGMIYYIHKYHNFVLVKLFLVYIIELHINILETPIPIYTVEMVQSR